MRNNALKKTGILRLILSVTAALLMLIAAPGCKTPEPSSAPETAAPETGAPVKPARTERYLYGINFVEMQMSDRVQTSEMAYLTRALGAESVRISAYCMQTGTVMDGNVVSRIHSLLESLKFSGIDEVILTQGTLPLEGTLGNYTPYPDPEDDEYLAFLDEVEEMARLLGTEYKEAEYIQIGHRMNDDFYLHPIGWKEENSPVDPFTVEEKAMITADVCFRVTKGLRAAGSDALTIMPAFSQYDTDDTKMYLKTIYQLIAEGKHGSDTVDDFFSIVSFTANFNEEPGQRFTDACEAIRKIMIDAGDDGRHAFVSEIGFDTSVVSEDDAKAWIRDLYERAEAFPYIESVQYYRMFTDNEEAYGLIREPRSGFSPTAAGNEFYAMTGSKADLEKYVIKEDQYSSGDNVALNVPTKASSSCEHPGWGWSLAGINNGTLNYGGWSNYYELGSEEWATVVTGTGAPSPDYPEWVEFDLPYLWEIDAVRLYPRNEIDEVFHQRHGMPEEIAIEISEDGETWTEIAFMAIEPKIYPDDVTILTRDENPPIEITFEPVKTKYVRVFFKKLRSAWQHTEDAFFVQLEEIEIIMH